MYVVDGTKYFSVLARNLKDLMKSGKIIREVSPVPVMASIAKKIPVLDVARGVCPLYQGRNYDQFLQQLKVMGFLRNHELPHSSLDRQGLPIQEESGFGYENGVEVLKLAREMDMLTIGYAFTEDEVERLARAGVDLIAVHVGLTTGGIIGAKTTVSVEEAIEKTNKLLEVAFKIRKDFIPLTRGGQWEILRP